MHSKPELLAPCGSPESLDAALKAGADAVYFGGADFNARINAHNFSLDEIAEAIDKCHSRGTKAYITLNTLVLEREYARALEYVSKLWESGVDALIAADLGLCREIRDNFPHFELHASTQMGVHNSDGAKALADIGFSRVVVARELSKPDIESIVSTGVEVEAFVHGALCVCHSGQCLFSSIVGGRSGNRGLCAQPCRLAYNGAYPLSLKDNCLAAHVTEILHSGIASLKIEGRMKSPDYVYSAVRTWRELIDSARDATPKEIESMARVFSREGFTDGYYTHKLDKSMLGTRTDSQKSQSRAQSQKRVDIAPKRVPIEPCVREQIAPSKHAPYFKRQKEIRHYARFYNPNVIPRSHPFDVVYLPLECWDKRANGVLMPPVITDYECDKVYAKLEKIHSEGCEHAIATNVGQFARLKEMGFVIHADFRMGAYSAKTAEVLYDMGASEVIFSPELTMPQLRDILAPTSAIVYGSLPLMVLERRLGTDKLRDRRGVSFPILREAGRDIVLNSAVTYMLDKQKALESSGIVGRHYIFTTENMGEVNEIVRAITTHAPSRKQNIRRIKDK